MYIMSILVKMNLNKPFANHLALSFCFLCIRVSQFSKEGVYRAGSLSGALSTGHFCDRIISGKKLQESIPFYLCQINGKWHGHNTGNGTVTQERSLLLRTVYWKW